MLRGLFGRCLKKNDMKSIIFQYVRLKCNIRYVSMTKLKYLNLLWEDDPFIMTIISLSTWITLLIIMIGSCLKIIQANNIWHAHEKKISKYEITNIDTIHIHLMHKIRHLYWRLFVFWFIRDHVIDQKKCEFRNNL